MAWRAPRYAYLHAARDAGVSAITAVNTFSTTQPEDHLIDDRAGSLTTFTASASDHGIDVDRGAAGLEAIDRLWIPSGHNWSGWDVRVMTSATGAFAGEETEVLDPDVAGQAVGSGAIDLALTSSTDRYIRLDWPNEVTINPQLGELVLTRTRTLIRGIEQGWQDELQSNTEFQDLNTGGQAALVKGADQRSFRWRYRAVSDAADLSVFDELAALGMTAPLLIDPPFDDESSIWCRLQRQVRRVQDPAVPASSDARQSQIDLELLEHVL